MSRGFAFLASLVLALLLQTLELPSALAPLRPSWPLLILGYWALYVPAAPTMLSAFVLGLCCDVLFSSALGAHALALVLCVALIVRLRGVYTLFSMWQAALMLAPIWALYAFVMFWIDGLTKHAALPALRWIPVASTTVAWPIYAMIFHGVRARRTRELNRMRLP